MTDGSSPNSAVPPQILGTVLDLWKAAHSTDEYLTFADAKREQDREALLRSLKQ
jgi:hypothetical protein